METILRSLYDLLGSNSFVHQPITDETIEQHGRIDVLINNAGITRDGLIMRMKEDDFDRVISVNLKGTFNCSQIVLKKMIKQEFTNVEFGRWWTAAQRD